MTRIAVRKTYKLFIGGAFPRTESGRYFSHNDASGALVAQLCRASRKDLRNAVKAARKAQPAWAGRTAFNRAQILYRAAEMMESRRALFVERAARDLGVEDAEAHVSAAIDTWVAYAGWADKLSMVFGGVNPVAAPFFNVTTITPLGVVTALPAAEDGLRGLVEALAATIVSGNATVMVVDGPACALAIELAEVLATSDVPGGVVNILTGQRDELLPHVGSHRDIDGVYARALTTEQHQALDVAAADSVKRVRVEPAGLPSDGDDLHSPYRILPFVEYQTAWHPMGR